ncbi:MAG: hypothetical protein ABSH06_25595 [Thermodesulfobacteriota bacterium]
MVEFRYAKGRLIDSIRFISERNRLAHRYLNFRWQAIRLFAEKRDLIVRIVTTLLEEQERKE